MYPPKDWMEQKIKEMLYLRKLDDWCKKKPDRQWVIYNDELTEGIIIKLQDKIKKISKCISNIDIATNDCLAGTIDTVIEEMIKEFGE